MNRVEFYVKKYGKLPTEKTSRTAIRTNNLKINTDTKLTIPQDDLKTTSSANLSNDTLDLTTSRDSNNETTSLTTLNRVESGENTKGEIIEEVKESVYQNEYGETLAMIILRNSKDDIPDQYQHDPNIADNFGFTIDMVYMITRNKEPEEWMRRENKEYKNFYGYTALMYYIGYVRVNNNIDCNEEYIKKRNIRRNKRVDDKIIIKNKEYSNTDFNIPEYLLYLVDYENPNRTYYDEDFFIDLEIKLNEQKEIQKSFMKKMEDEYYGNGLLKTTSHTLQNCGMTEAMLWLKYRKCEYPECLHHNPNIQNKENMTLSMIWCEYVNCTCLRYRVPEFLRHDPTLKDNFDRDISFYQVIFNSTEPEEWMKTDPSLQDKQGNTCAMYWLHFKSTDVPEQLRHDPNIRNNFGEFLITIYLDKYYHLPPHIKEKQDPPIFPEWMKPDYDKIDLDFNESSVRKLYGWVYERSIEEIYK